MWTASVLWPEHVQVKGFCKEYVRKEKKKKLPMTRTRLMCLPYTGVE